MRFSRKELVDFGKAWLIVSFAFAIVFRSAGIDFFYLFLASGLTVGVGFLLHELAHKIVAQMYGYWAEFRSDDKMLLLALIMSFFGFVFAAPGGVLIPAIADKKKTGLIALAGPLVNVFLALLFFGLDYFYESGFFVFGSHINSFIAVFNLIPFAQFDGEKIFAWNKFVWGSCLAIAGVVLGIVLYLQI